MSKIQWTEQTWNPVVGCTRVSAGCDNCYAVKMTHRLGKMAEADRAAGRDPGKKAAYEGLTVLNNRGDRHFNGQVRTVPEALDIPLRRRTPTTWFVNSMSDLFHERVPFEFIAAVYAVAAACPQHIMQVLTKRPERAAEFYEWMEDTRAGGAVTPQRKMVIAIHDLIGGRAPGMATIDGSMWPLPNVWLGTSCENQEAMDRRVWHLQACPSAVQFISCEPLLGPVKIPKTWLHYKGTRQWVIAGGESGRNARPCDIAWLRSIVRQCDDAGLPCFVKQLGSAVRGIDCPKCGRVGEIHTATGIVPCPRCHGLDVVNLRDPKGGDPAEWPEDLRVRQMPHSGGKGE